MGSYGIGVGRSMAAVVETHHDDKGIVWPVAVAPYEVVGPPGQGRRRAVPRRPRRSTRGSLAAGIEVLLDDREDRPGVKFSDAELIGSRSG